MQESIHMPNHREGWRLFFKQKLIVIKGGGANGESLMIDPIKRFLACHQGLSYNLIQGSGITCAETRCALIINYCF